MSRSLLSMKPAAAAAHPEYELSIEMTTGMSPPPMDATRCQPSARAITVMISSGTMLAELTNQTIRTAETSGAARFILCRCGRVSGLDEIRVLSLRNATTEPVRVTAPINTPRNTSTCLLYTSDAADEEDSVDLGGRR